jgi:hypothetical protein
MEFGKSSDRHYGATVFKNNINLSTNVISLTFATGSSSFVYLPDYDPPAFRVFLYLATGYLQIPTGLKTETVYYMQSQSGYGAVKLYLTKADLDNNNPFDFTAENTADFDRCMVATVDYKYTVFPCIEKAAIDVEDIFCCPPLPAMNVNIPEYMTLDTGSEDDSGDYYLATYPAMYSIPPLDPPNGNLAGTPANLAYKSRNKPFVPITRIQSNIYQGPSLYGTFNETYTLAWEIYTEAEIISGFATGNIRIKVLCTIWSYGMDNGQRTLGLKTIQEYYSDWQDKAVFNYTGTCTILNNMDVDFMFPSVAGYYATPAGLPIPHSVSVLPSTSFVTMPSTVYLNMPDAVFETPEGNIPLGNIAETLNYNATLGVYYSDLKNYYLIPGRIAIFVRIFPNVNAQNKFALGNDSTVGGLTYQTASNSIYGSSPQLYFTNDIEERGPLVGSLSSAGAGYGGLFSGLAHGATFIDSRAKAIYTSTAAGNPIFDLEGHVIGVSLVGGAGAGYITPPTVAISNSNAICVATLGTGVRAGMVDFVTVTNSATNFGDRVNSRAFFSAPPPPYFNLTEKNFRMELFYSQYNSARKRQSVLYYDFFKSYYYSITSFHPDAYITSLTPPPS